MENGEDLRSILPYLPVMVRLSSLFWPSQVVEALKALSRGADHSRVDSGEVLFLAISDLRQSLSLTHSSERLANSAADGYALFLDDLISRAEAAKWFGEVVPALANFLLRLPSLFEAHYQNADGSGGREGVKTGLRILESQEPGIVFINQNGRQVMIMGNDTWQQLFPHHFKKSYPFASFNMKDLHMIENGCTKNLFSSLHEED